LCGAWWPECIVPESPHKMSGASFARGRRSAPPCAPGHPGCRLRPFAELQCFHWTWQLHVGAPICSRPGPEPVTDKWRSPLETATSRRPVRSIHTDPQPSFVGIVWIGGSSRKQAGPPAPAAVGGARDERIRFHDECKTTTSLRGWGSMFQRGLRIKPGHQDTGAGQIRAKRKVARMHTRVRIEWEGGVLGLEGSDCPAGCGRRGGRVVGGISKYEGLQSGFGAGVSCV
jgi:hypothetical protein